ncbi:MAG: aminoacyl-tRNA hydrolase [Halothermotrichaceae bacterium]
MYLITGLGNPGRKYENTRHNVGFKAIYSLAEKYNIKKTSRKFKAITARTRIAGQKVIMVQPQTYMNNSGESVKLVKDYYDIPIDKIIIIYDDMDLSLGQIRIKKKGSAGGHNGLKNIIKMLGSNKIPRIRIGIGRPENKYIDVVDYVLSRFSGDENKEVEQAINKVTNAVEEILDNGFNVAMNKFN